MTFATHCQIARGRLDPAPMVNVVFLLLIFLVLSSPYVLQPGFGTVVLPAASNAASASFQTLVVTITRDDLVFFNNQPVTLEDLRRALQASARKSPRQELVIKADKQVSHGAVVQIMDLAVGAGISAINLATRPELPLPAAAP